MIYVSRVKLYPRGSQHEVHGFLISMSPKLKHPFQVKLTYHFVSSNHCVHVCSESEISVHTFLVKLDFNEGVWVCPDDKVDLSPVNHDNFLDVVDYLR